MMKSGFFVGTHSLMVDMAENGKERNDTDFDEWLMSENSKINNSQYGPLHKTQTARIRMSKAVNASKSKKTNLSVINSVRTKQTK